MFCSMEEFEVCSNGGVEAPIQSAQDPTTTPAEAVEAEPEAENGAWDSEAETSSVHVDSYGTDDDQFSDVGDPPDTEVIKAVHSDLTRRKTKCKSLVHMQFIIASLNVDTTCTCEKSC